jgi:hypothetical protein
VKSRIALVGLLLVLGLVSALLMTGVVVVHGTMDRWTGASVRINVGERGYGYVSTGGDIWGASAVLVSRKGGFGVAHGAKSGWYFIAERFKP